MSDAVMAALIGAAASIIVNLINNAAQRKKKAVEEAKRETRLEDRLSSIETKLDIHNGYAEKLGSIQIDIAYIKGQLKGGQ